MRAHQVFAAMSDEQAERMLGLLKEQSPAVYTQSVAAAASAFKARPRFLLQQPDDKRARMVRRALSRVAAAPLAEEVLASYFLDARKELLVEWLDAAGVAHEDGSLEDDRPAPPDAKALGAALEKFRAAGGDDAEERELLLRAFAAQSAIDWPDLEARLSARDA